MRIRGSSAKIVTVLGARPQFIKASVVSRALAQVSSVTEVLVHTGQHFDANMSKVFFDELGIPEPRYRLDVSGGTHGAMTGRMLEQVEKVLLEERPDAVLVYGDTNSTLAGALAAAKLHIPVAHVEAGLRSFNLRMPEEINRILTDRIARWLFVPSASAYAQLMREGADAGSITNVGDVMYDVTRHYGAQVAADRGLLAELGMNARSYALVTVHRAENTDDPRRLSTIASALLEFSGTLPVVWPVHPRTRQALEKLRLLDALSAQIAVIEPVGYLAMVQLERFAALIATDSGGIQKEAFFHRVPCVTMRDETEWVELVEAGWNRLSPPESVAGLLSSLRAALGTSGRETEPYGDGSAALRIAGVLAEDLSQ